MECKYTHDGSGAIRVAMELIDTLWNVNKVEMQNTRRAFLRINRYIMECKYPLLPLRNKR